MPKTFVRPWTSLLAPDADADTSHILGREGFFDCFRITFDKSRLITQFELLE
jgi:hypothetical protein